MVRLRRRFRSFPVVRQQGDHDCGAACLVAVLRYHGRYVHLPDVRDLLAMSSKGTSMHAMAVAADKLGFKAEGLLIQGGHMRDLPLPVIAHLRGRRESNHFVVIVRSSQRSVQYMDPATGCMTGAPYHTFRQNWTGAVLSLTPRDSGVLASESAPRWVQMLAVLRPHSSAMIQALIGAVIYSVLGFAGIVYLRKVVDAVLPDRDRSLLLVMSVAVAFITVVQIAINVFRQLLVINTSQRVDASLALRYVRHLLHLPASYFDGMKVGELATRLGDTVRIRRIVHDVAIQTIVNITIFLVSFALIIAYSGTLATITAVVITMHIIIFVLSNRALRRLQQAVLEATANVQATLIESVGIIGTIKRMALEDFVEQRLRQAYLRLLKTGRSTATFTIGAGTASDVISRSFGLLILWIGAAAVLRGALSTGELMASYALVGMLTGPVTALLLTARPLQEAVVAGERLYEVLDIQPEDLDIGAGIAEAVPTIQFSNVAFGYPGRGQLFSDLSFCAEQGHVTGLVGHNGCGKSTIGSLLIGLYQQSRGRISIGGRDIEYISKRELRRFVAVVPQRVELLSATISENICLGDSQPRRARISDLCCDLGLEGLIESLPQGLDTVVGERGVNLSGGQAQLITVARALYRDPEVLFLDEATSALDAETEQRVQQVIRRLARSGKCVIVVAHRLSSVRGADTILVMSSGSILESGPHDALLNRGGTYAALWKAQYGLEASGRIGA